MNAAVTRAPLGNDELLTVPQAAERLHLKAGTVYNWISKLGMTEDDGVIHLLNKAVRINWTPFYERIKRDR